MSEQTTQKKHFLRKILRPRRILTLVLLLTVGLVGVGLGHTWSTQNKTTKLGFEDLGQLVTQAAYCTEIHVTDAARDLFGVEIPFTQSTHIYSYDIKITAGLDFEKIDWDIVGTTIEEKLPPVEILGNEPDLDSFKVYYEEESIFRPIRLDENNEAIKEMKQQAEADAIANGLLENARSNAETILTAFFAGVYDLDEYTIQFTDL